MTSPLATAVRSHATEMRVRQAAAEQRQAELTQEERYRLDPFALLDEGRITIWSKEEKRDVRLRPYDYQREALAAWIDLDHLKATARLRFRNVVVEKSRQQGITWIFAFGCWWAITYHDCQGIVRAQSSGYIDDGGSRNTWKTFLGKIRYVDRKISQFHPDTPGLGQLRFTGKPTPGVKNLVRPDSFIVGAGEDDDTGRSATMMFAIVDELAFIEHGERVHQALSEACPDGRVYVSTPFGKGNVFYRIASRPPAGWTALRTHWSQHPVHAVGLHVAAVAPDPQAGEPGRHSTQPTDEMREAAAACELCEGTIAGVPYDPTGPRSHRYPGRLTSPSYEARIVDKTDEQVAQELDIDYESSVEARVYKEASRELHLAAEPVPYEPLIRLELGWDYGLECTAIPICQETPTEYRVLGYVKIRDATPDQVVAALRVKLLEIGYEARPMTPQWTRQILAYGDPAGEAREVGSGKSVVSEYQRLGFQIMPAPNSIPRTIRAVKRLLRGFPKRVVFSPAHGGEELLDDLIANRWPTDRTGARREGAPAPENDDANHGSRAFAYLVTAKFPPPTEPDPHEVPGSGNGHSRGVISPRVRYGMSL